MFLNKIIKYSFICFLLVGVFSCKSVVEDLNEDPNNPQDAPPELMNTAMQLGNVLAHEGELARLVGMWSGYFTGSDRQYIGLNTYNVTAADFDSPWATVYSDVLAQSRIIQSKADELRDLELKGIAQIIEAHVIGTATALWGDIPYTQAADVETYPEPAYDAQADVYADLQALLDEAIANVGSSSNTRSDATTLGGGTWAQVANTLKARYYLHTGDYDSAAAAAANGISASGNDWMADHTVSGYTDGRFNLIFSFCIWWREGYMTAQDAPLALMLDPASSDYRGNSKTDETGRFGWYYNQWGWYGANYDPHWWAGGMFWRDEPYPLLTYNENQLIAAEALLRGSSADMGGALAALNNVRGALDVRFGGGGDTTYVAYEMADFEVGGMMNPDGVATADALLAEIAKEKYVCMYAQIEGFNDLRRWDNILGIPSKTSGNIPERIVYPQSEVNANDNVPQPLPGIDVPTPVNQ